MRVIVLTCFRNGLASLCVPSLCESSKIQVVKVVFAEKMTGNRWMLIKRKLKKILKIGLLGALNGIRIRKWFEVCASDDIEAICKDRNIEFVVVPYISSDETVSHFEMASADLGLSLGNGYIPAKVFSVPKYGMLNIHTEILPSYQNAQSIIWPIYNEEKRTGFTIHQVDKKIDAGGIAYQDVFEIEFHRHLSDTVKQTLAKTVSKIPSALRFVCENYLELKDTVRAQSFGRTYTTPSARQFLRMLCNNRKIFRSNSAAQ